MLLRASLFTLLALLLSKEAAADLLEIPASRDNTMYAESGSTSNGSGMHLFAGNNGNGNPRRGLMAFDLASMIPAGSTINVVSLRTYMSRSSAGMVTVSLHPALADWGEGSSNAGGNEGGGTSASTGDATWTHRFWPNTTWSSSGGDYGGVVSSQLITGENYYTFSGAGLAAEAQSWLDSPATNFGLVFIGGEFQSNLATRFDTSENPDPTRRPALIVDYNPPGTMGACCFADGSCISTVDGAACAMMGGTYGGDGSNCSIPPCPQPLGACCLPDASCSETEEAICLSMNGFFSGMGTTCATTICPLILEPYVDFLPIPPTAQPTMGQVGGTANYTIPIQQFTMQLHRDLPATTVWGYGGMIPGPTIEAFAGLPVSVSWQNDLRDSQGSLRTDHFLPVDACLDGPDIEGNTPRLVTHLHGAHTPAGSDGFPEDTTLPGQSQTATYPNWQIGSTLWYHDDAIGIARSNMTMGLAGMYLLRDNFENSLNLPSGEFEVPLILTDKTVLPDGSFEAPSSWQSQEFGDKILVNGKIWPFFLAKRGKYRFRMLNASTARFYTLSFPGGPNFSVLGGDGGFLPAPVTKSEVTFGPGERLDIVVDFNSVSGGTQLVLTNSAPAPFPMGNAANDVPNVMKFFVAAQPGFTGPLPSSLRPSAPLDPGGAVLERDFILAAETDPCTGNRWTINGERWDDAPLSVEPWTTEIWSFANDSTLTQSMHLQQSSFQILDRTPFQLVSGQVVTMGAAVGPAPEEAAWKDTVQVPPGVVTRVIARFDHYSGEYALGSSSLGRRDHDMKRPFAVEPQMGSFCNGDGGDGMGCSACPCSNDAPPGTVGGCLNNRGRAGFLQTSGIPSVSNDTLRFEARDTALSTFGVLLSGAQRAPANAVNPCFGMDSGIAAPNLNGLRCVVQSVQRHGSRSTDFSGNIGVAASGSGSNGWGAPSGPVGGLISQGGFMAGQTRHYQLFYREAAFSLCLNDINTSQGISVTFVP